MRKYDVIQVLRILGNVVNRVWFKLVRALAHLIPILVDVALPFVA